MACEQCLGQEMTHSLLVLFVDSNTAMLDTSPAEYSLLPCNVDIQIHTCKLTFKSLLLYLITYKSNFIAHLAVIKTVNPYSISLHVIHVIHYFSDT